AGEYVTEFGSPGTGPGQLDSDWWLRLDVDAKGNVLLTDQANHRVQRWRAAGRLFVDYGTRLQDDPSLDVATEGGLVESVEGEEVGEIAYEHDDGLLTAVSGPEGETSYEYDGNERMSKITLADGTYAEIAYEPTYGRVSAVTVAIGGSDPKTTYFNYNDQPQRRTTVTAPGVPVTTYEFAADGSMLKWWNTKKPPTIDDVAGTLYDIEQRETAAAIAPGLYNLTVQAFSAEGIASIEVIANNNVLVSEKTCVQVPGPPVECETEKDEWVMETGNFAPGILYLEVVATDRLGESAAERFWVNVPYTPPPDPEADEPPKFADILSFREEFGLDLDIQGDEEAINDRVYNLIGDWHNPNTAAGQVARATMNRWGVPLRSVDAAELEYRNWFYGLNTERIDRWVEETQPSSFAGYYIDHAAGGIMHIGFIDNQAERLTSLAASLSLVAGERLQVYPTAPTTSYLSVQTASESVSNAIESNPTLGELVVSVKFDESGKTVRVGTPNVIQVKSILDQVLGSGAPIAVEYDASGGRPLSGRFRNQGRMRAGDFISSRVYVNGVHVGNRGCTAGFGAKAKAGEVRGRAVWSVFVLTAGHCTQLWHQAVYRSTDAEPKNEEHWKEVGMVTRDAFAYLDPVRTDAEAIEVNDGGVVPQGIFGAGGALVDTKPAATAKKGDVVCYSGARSQLTACGLIVARSTHWVGGDGVARGGYWVKFSNHPIDGDSGGPVWNLFTGASIGLVSAGRPENVLTETLVEPLLHPPHMGSTQVPGILNNPHIGPLSLKLGG
ncbi:MAG TPA: hypothetical protein VEW07_05860, partial [Solirubrobacterales bacterium]|nr:hypothetical protein [Solirubrobacterales bacterium]